MLINAELFESTTIKNALYNTLTESRTSVTYAKGVIVGIVAFGMAQGISFQMMRKIVFKNLPLGYRTSCIPKDW